jgi:hypothetical protein
VSSQGFAQIQKENEMLLMKDIVKVRLLVANEDDTPEDVIVHQPTEGMLAIPDLAAMYERDGEDWVQVVEFRCALIDAGLNARAQLFTDQWTDDGCYWTLQVQVEDTKEWIPFTTAMAAAIIELADTYGMDTEKDNFGQVLIYTGYIYNNANQLEQMPNKTPPGESEQTPEEG